jgi:PPOX class probable F420-dependent enzyme
MLGNARVGHLGLIDDLERPRVLPVTFVLYDGDLWSAIDRKPKRVAASELARVRYLRRRPAAALTVDRYDDDDWNALAWVQALGRVEILEAASAPEALAALRAKYEQYRGEEPPGPLICLRPEGFLFWRASG